MERTPEQIKERKIKNALLYTTISKEELMKDLFESDFSEYLASTRIGNGNPRIPLKIYFSLETYSKYVLESSRLVTIKDLEKTSGVNVQNLRNHIMNFIREGIISEHRYSQKMLGSKKAVTYMIKKKSDWNDNTDIDIQNHITILYEKKQQEKNEVKNV